MKYIKSLIGKIAFIETNANYKDSLKKIPKEARIMKSWEFIKLVDDDFQSLKNIPRDWYFCYATDKYFRACRLDGFGNGSRFLADDGSVVSADFWLRGVLVVKRKR